MQQPPKHSYIRRSMQLGLLGLAAIGVLNYDQLLNEYALATYKATPKIVAFESRVSLTPYARAILYRAKPQFDDKTNFNTDCDTRPHELELGCYFRNRIYVLQIDNSSLAPEMDVVSAHELLHAAWVKLSSSDKVLLSRELERVYGLVADADLRDRMAGYAKSEPGEEANELHSILGTEYAQLSPALEEHYSEYFTNRNQIVGAHAAYQSVFDSRRVELEAELAAIRGQKAQLSILNRQLDAYKANGQVQAYNALVPRQNKMVDEINSRIEKYRLGVEEYNGLSKSLDSQQITDTEAVAR